MIHLALSIAAFLFLLWLACWAGALLWLLVSCLWDELMDSWR